MSTSRVWSIGAVAMLGVSSFATVVRTPLGESRDPAAVERAYAVAIEGIADSAIHRLDFIPVRTQLRIQAAFLMPTQDAVPFDALASNGNAAAVAIDAAVDRFSDVRVPDDLKALHGELVNALKDATRASANLTGAAHSCQVSPISIERCQVPFTAASSRLAASYRRYLGARNKIGAQIVDTDTHLAAFKLPGS